MNDSVLELLAQRPIDRHLIQQMDEPRVAAAVETLFLAQERERFPDWEELGSIGGDLWLSQQTHLYAIVRPWLLASDPRRSEIAAAFLDGYWSYSPPVEPQVVQLLDHRMGASQPGSGLLHTLLLLVCKLTRASLAETQLSARIVLGRWIDLAADRQIEKETLGHLRDCIDRARRRKESAR